MANASGGLVQGHIYWANGGAPTDGTINEASLNGGNAHAVFTGQDGPTGMAVSGNHIYWADCSTGTPGAGTINEANLNGSNPHILVTGLFEPVGLAVSGDHIYWTEETPETINEANLDGTDPHSVITGQNSPVGAGSGR